jgi:hypothetical protein
MLDTRYWMLDGGIWLLVAGRWSLVTGPWQSKGVGCKEKIFHHHLTLHHLPCFLSLAPWI